MDLLHATRHTLIHKISNAVLKNNSRMENNDSSLIMNTQSRRLNVYRMGKFINHEETLR